MKRMMKTGALAAALMTGASGFALAQSSGTATADLNVRSGPGPQYEVVTVIPSSETAAIDGCLEGSKWCQVQYGGQTGWAYSDYLTIQAEGQAVVLTERPATTAVPVVTYENSEAGGFTAGAATGALAGALIGGPIGAAVGGVAGAAVGASITPPDRVQTYVVENRVEPVYLEGEVVVGAGVPDTVTLQTVPDYDYDYAYVNGQPVLIDPGTRQIVYVYR